MRNLDQYMKPQVTMTQRLKWITIAIIVIAIYLWAILGLDEINIKENAIPTMQSMLDGLMNPDLDYIYDPEGEDLLRMLLQTLAIAFLGTFISAILCIPFGFLAAYNITQNKYIAEVNKFILSFIRVFPEIIMALIFIKAVGPGAFAGVLAVGVNSIGMLGKLFSDDIENLDMGATEALKSAGANRFKSIIFAVVPQVLPAYLSFVLYRFEINLRSASILGLIGAGGIGTPLIFALQMRDWNRVAIILIGIIILVITVDMISSYIRKKLV